MVAISENDARATPAPNRTLYWHFNRFLERHLPDRLYPRSLIIIITPMVLLQSIMAFIFMERHWDKVTKQLSKSVARDIGYVVATYDYLPKTDESLRFIVDRSNSTMALGLSVIHDEPLPPPYVRDAYFTLLDIKLSKYIERYIDNPFWVDTLGRSGYVDVRVQVDEGLIFRFLTKQDRAYASNSHIFLLWMVGSSLVLLFVAIIFMRNQIRPIQQLAQAAQSFGMGRDVPDFAPTSGAAEVRAAASAFLMMRERIERHVEQRTAMLAGVSHDLRTVLTRFKLQLAVLPDSPEVRDLKSDVDEMQGMLEDYMAFVRGDGGESTQLTDIRTMLQMVVREAGKWGSELTLDVPDPLVARVKPNVFKRCVCNVVNNACQHGKKVAVTARITDEELRIVVDDNGPGIPPEQREAAFRPFFRLDNARNQDHGGSGLGLTIARDIARGQGGDVHLGVSAMGGLQAVIQIPV